MKDLIENKPLILLAPIKDSNGEDTTIIELNGFPKKAWKKTGKLRSAMYGSFIEATMKGAMGGNEEDQDEKKDEKDENKKEDEGIDGKSLATLLMMTDFDIEINTNRFQKLATDFDLLSVNEKPFTIVQWHSLGEMDLERIMYEYLAVFLFPSVMRMIQD